MNNVSLIGRPTRDPELRFTPGGVAYSTFFLAVDREFRNREGKREADFIFVRVWNKQAEYVANYVNKGRLISVKGRISTGSRKEKDGSTKYFTEVVAEDIGFLGPRKDESAGNSDAREEMLNIPENDGFTMAEGEKSPY